MLKEYEMKNIEELAAQKLYEIINMILSKVCLIKFQKSLRINSFCGFEIIFIYKLICSRKGSGICELIWKMCINADYHRAFALRAHL